MRKYTERTIKFYNVIADNYIKSDAAVVLKGKINKFIRLLPGKKVLDVACGPGHDTDYLVRKGFNCLGIDLSEKMIKTAKQNFKGRFKIMNFFNLSFKNNSFDGIWCSSIFVHVDKKDLPQLLENFRKILKNNGIIGLITVKKQKIKINKCDNRKYVMYGRKEFEDTRKYIMYGRKEFEDCLKNMDYKILISEVFVYGEKERLFIIARNQK